MEILVIGGTVFLSRAVVETALARGHDVTTFSRGLNGDPVVGARALTGDRTRSDDLEQLRGQSFDLVFDTGYFPDQVKASAELLEPSAGHYCFVSSINAYPGWPEQADYRVGGVYDGDPDAAGEDVPEGLADGSGPYGWRKVGAERAVLRAFGEHRTSILRAGLIVGPHDIIGRLPWWLNRVSRGGEVLAPGSPTEELALIDARDIAEFALKLPSGTFEVTGPPHQITRQALFDDIRRSTGSTAEFTWVDDKWLADQPVEGWTELPLWIPSEEAPSVFKHDTSAAEAAGLACRPVSDTVADTWKWMQSIEGGWQPSVRTPGLAAERESELLAAWHNR
ncbi:NAD-dependent epimerase/dehydratase family protein [Jatrophihabitans sp. DSM 45814]